MAGLGFGAGADPTATAVVSAGDCLTTSWASATSVICVMDDRATSGQTFDGLTVASLVSTRVSGFTFDGFLSADSDSDGGEDRFHSCHLRFHQLLLCRPSIAPTVRPREARCSRSAGRALLRAT